MKPESKTQEDIATTSCAAAGNCETKSDLPGTPQYVKGTTEFLEVLIAKVVSGESGMIIDEETFAKVFPSKEAAVALADVLGIAYHHKVGSGHAFIPKAWDELIEKL